MTHPTANPEWQRFMDQAARDEKRDLDGPSATSSSGANGRAVKRRPPAPEQPAGAEPTIPQQLEAWCAATRAHAIPLVGAIGEPALRLALLRTVAAIEHKIA